MKSKTLSKNLKSKYAIENEYDSVFVGNQIKVSTDGLYMFCPRYDTIHIIHTDSRKLYKTIGEADSPEEITYIALNSDSSQLAVSYRHGIIKIWDWHKPDCLRTWKSHFTTPIISMEFDQLSSTLLATGSTINSQIKLWDLSKNYCTHNFKEAGAGGISILKFHCNMLKNIVLSVIAACDNNAIKIYNLHEQNTSDNSNCHSLTGHTANITGLIIIASCNKLLSCGRDRLIILWDLESYRSLKFFQAQNGFDGGMVHVPYNAQSQNDHHTGNGDYQIVSSLITADSDLTFRRWLLRSKMDENDAEGGTVLFNLLRVDEKLCYGERRPTLPNDADDKVESGDRDDGALLPRSLTYNDTVDRVYMTNYQNDILTASASTLQPVSLFAGDLEEVTDVKFFTKSRKQEFPYLAVADNSPQPKIFALPSFNTFLLYGHSENVLAMDTFATKKNLLATASKDNTLKLWKVGFKKRTFDCLHTFVGHTNSVTSVKCCSTTGGSGVDFILSGSSDLTVKCWDIKLATPHLAEKDEIVSDQSDNEELRSSTKKKLKLSNGRDHTVESVSVRYTIKAHDKEISCICTSPRNSKYFATGSMDKTAKLWTTLDGKLVGTFRGHKRGIWDAKFSPVHQVLATCSGDTTIKLWATSDFSCIKTLEGHSSAVLHLDFVTNGTQLLSSSSDGLVKLWTLENESATTFDAHRGKIWSFSISDDETLLATGGGADGRILIWKDVSQEEKEQEVTQKETKLQSQQDISNLIKLKRYDHRIFKLAISSEDPNSLLIALTDMLKDSRNQDKLEKAIKTLDMGEIDSLLRYVSKWNTNAKQCYIAQTLMSSIFHSFHPNQLKSLPNLSYCLQCLIPYTNRHFERMTKLLQDSMLVEYMAKCVALKPRIADHAVKGDSITT